MLNEQQFCLFGQIQISQTGGQPYSDTSTYGECSLPVPEPVFHFIFGLFKRHYNKWMWRINHLVYSSEIRTHDLVVVSLLYNH